MPCSDKQLTELDTGRKQGCKHPAGNSALCRLVQSRLAPATVVKASIVGDSTRHTAGQSSSPARHRLCAWATSCTAVAVAVQVLAAVGETVWVMDDHGATDQALPAGCGGVASMAVAPNGAFLAVACLDGKLRVMSSGEYARDVLIAAVSAGMASLTTDFVGQQIMHKQQQQHRQHKPAASCVAGCQHWGSYRHSQHGQHSRHRSSSCPPAFCCIPCVKHSLCIFHAHGLLGSYLCPFSLSVGCFPAVALKLLHPALHPSHRLQPAAQ